MEKNYVEELGYGYLYHYNTYTKKYACIPRDAVDQYFNGYPTSKFTTGEGEHTITYSEKSFNDAAWRMKTQLEMV